MDGGRERFTCPKCCKVFFYWLLKATAHPKVKCSFCSAEFFPKGEPPAAPPADPKPAPSAASSGSPAT